ncbi:nucleotide pyrophosphohydrolase [Pelagicoccus sp. NFK12]|jgi:NTP pyrophosphatase (non-canonical NTP hydrolase)|uniref:Nucleotide pyrophosphohydrolase n=1 Tax=Pelagicoccus enzymogenes TaxID=2773457 RepID=A0A927FBQ2_9BACT|nr:nucleotide pyrophosphohydrolase [Pelagicoccus enzymogenes]MBD5782162.1 nucleotide pyrophosphohydrolase [Pelagicoccus enzymogenes]MDQ8196915.1 nucleotide pyrophosphohydrolase [Pelagicoccus enzymogenes]
MSWTDKETPVSELKERVAAFARERDWEQFHTLKNLSVALAGEAAELMEPFQWLEGDRCKALLQDSAKREAIEDELADVVIYALQFANRGGIDLALAIDRKMAKNALKYPVDLAKGSAEKRG